MKIKLFGYILEISIRRPAPLPAALTIDRPAAAAAAAAIDTDDIRRRARAMRAELDADYITERVNASARPVTAADLGALKA